MASEESRRFEDFAAPSSPADELRHERGTTRESASDAAQEAMMAVYGE